MGKPLNEEQRAFISKYIVNASKKQAAAVVKAYTEFDRRNGKIKAELAKLPDGQQKTDLEKRRNMTELKGKLKSKSGGQFAVAYDEMEAIKADARAAAKGYVKSLSPGLTQQRLDRFDRDIAIIDGSWTQAQADMKSLIDELTAIDVPPLKDLAAIEKFRKTMTKQQARWRGDIQAARGLATAASAGADQLNAVVVLKEIKHEITQLRATADKKKIATLDVLDTRVTASDGRAKMGNGQYYDSKAITAEFSALEREAHGLIEVLIHAQNREGAPDTGDRFKHLEEQEKARLDQAMTAYTHAFGSDQAVLDPLYGGGSNAPDGPPPRAKFVASDLVPDDIGYLREDHIDDGEVTRIATALGDAAKQFVQTEGARNPNSDKLFDITMKSLNDLRLEIGGALGLTGDPAGWPPNSLKLVEEGAKAVKAAVIDSSPNKVSDQTVKLKLDGKDFDVPQTLSLNGDTYDQPQLLGKGGLGLITRYQKTGGNETVVVKSTLVTSGDQFVETDDEPSADVRSRKDMVTEMLAHRALMGGENHRPPANVVEMKGAAVGNNGALHMVMEEAGAGDASHLGHAVSALTRAGVLPKAAQQALQQDTMLQAARGLKAVHGLGLLHNDIKAVNYLVDDNGQVKAGDFGSAYSMAEGSDEKVPLPPTTPMYDYGSLGDAGNRTEKTDVYQLGCMLHGMASELSVDQTVQRAGFASEFQGKAQTGHEATSLDRLRNAMLAEKPEDRPTLDGVLLSSYLNDARDTFGDPDKAVPGGSDSAELVALRKAMAAYSKAVGREVGKLNQKIAEETGKLERALERAGDDPVKRAAAEQTALTTKQTIDSLQAQIDAVNKRPDVDKLLDAIRAASAPFGQARGDVEAQAWDFAYRKTMDGMQNINRPRPRLNAGQRRQVRQGAELRDQQESLQANPP